MTEANQAQSRALGRLAVLLPHEPQFTLSACRPERDTLRNRYWDGTQWVNDWRPSARTAPQQPDLTAEAPARPLEARP